VNIVLNNIEINIPGNVICKRAFAYGYGCLNKNITGIQQEWELFTKELLFSKVPFNEIEILFSKYLNNKAENKLKEN